MPTFAFTFEELEGSPEEEFSIAAGFTARRLFKVPYSARWTFAQGMALSAYPGFPTCRVTRIAPKPYHDDIGGTITDPSLQLPSYQFAEVECNYSIVQAQPDGSYLSYRKSGSAEFLTLPSRALKWEDNNEPVAPDAHAAILLPKSDHEIIWHRVQYPNWGLLDASIGKVNSIPFAIPVIGLVCPFETLMFLGYQVSTNLSPQGDMTWELALSFSSKRVSAFGGADYGWNHVYRDDPPGWQRPLSNDGHPSYALMNLAALFVQV